MIHDSKEIVLYFRLIMSDEITRFEFFPNEILLIIFEYINARDLYRSFYSLNSRINNTLQSINHLYILLGCIRFRHDIHDHLFASRVDTIVVQRSRLFDDFALFNHVRHLIFLDGSEGDISSIMYRLPSIEYLAIRIKDTPTHLNAIYQRIFSNDFVKLKSCVLNRLQAIESWDISPTIEFLHVHSDQSDILIPLLNACPNLHSLNLTIPTVTSSIQTPQVHSQLKRLTLRITTIDWIENSILKMFFLLLPNLERLSLERTMENCAAVQRLQKKDWLTAIIIDCLPCINSFQLILNICDKQEWNQLDRKTFQTCFANAHHNRYRFELIFK